MGDLYPVDVLGARKAGLQAVLLDPLDRLDYPVDRAPGRVGPSGLYGAAFPPALNASIFKQTRQPQRWESSNA